MPAEEQVRRAFAAGQHRRRVSPAQQDRERRRLREEQADHSRSPEQRQAGQGQRSGDGCPGAQRHSGQRAAQQEKAPGAAGGAGAGGPSSDAGTAGRAGGSTCSVQAQPAGSCGGGSTARPESPAIEIEVDEVEFVWAATPAGAGNTLAGVGGSWQAPATQRQGRSPADREEVPLGAARTPSFEAIIQGAQHSTDALLAAEEAGASSTSAGGLILAARCGPPGAGSQGRRLSPRPLLAQLAQALHGLPQRAAAAASSGKQRRQKEPAAEDVRPRLHAPPAAVQAATLRRGRLAAGHSADENSPL
ncbi:hypothetical protein ABPG75_010752 [Micractinium tetrahymenae]